MKAYELLESTGWCQGTYARDANGEAVHAMDEEACSYCILGAIWKTYGYGDASDLVRRILSKGKGKRRGHSIRSIAEWQDAQERTKEEVIAALKAADV